MLLLLLVLALSSCRPASRPGIEGGWSYEVAVGEGTRELRVEARFGRGSPEELSVASGAERFVRGVELSDGGRWTPVEPHGTSWFVPACRERGCRVRYRFDLLGSASLDSMERVQREGDCFVTMPAAWLLRPLFAVGDAPVSLRFVTTPDAIAVTGLQAAPGGSPATGPYLASVEDIPQPPYTAFGPLRTRMVQAPGGVIQVAIVPSARSLDDQYIASWVQENAARAARMFGRMPLPRTLVIVAASDDEGMSGGMTLGNGGASVMVWLGADSEPRHLADDWVLLHELIHVGFPSLPPEQHWMEEGLATYLGPLLRARSGQISELTAWEDLCRGVLKPRLWGPLDGGRSWAMVYWGGALYYLLADVEIRERTGGARSLDDALRGVVAQGGSVAQRWPLGRLLSVADGAVGGSTMARLYDELGRGPRRADVPALLARLGVQCGERVVLNDGAPLGMVRKAMTARW